MNIPDLIQAWNYGAELYIKQAKEAKSKELPYEEQITMAICLKACAKQLEEAINETEEKS